MSHQHNQDMEWDCVAYASHELSELSDAAGVGPSLHTSALLLCAR